MIVTFRRYYIDKFLNEVKATMRGRVLDVGGKKDNKRGFFRPPVDRVENWEYINIDASTNPDFIGSAEAMPIGDKVYDSALLCEVLDHLEKPESALAEIYRVLKSNGQVIITAPFLYPLHADPGDYQRWTASKLQLQLSRAGFKQITVKPMGGIFAVIFDLFHHLISRGVNKRSIRSKIFQKLHCYSFPVFKYLDDRFKWSDQFITSGYFVIASKEKQE